VENNNISATFSSFKHIGGCYRAIVSRFLILYHILISSFASSLLNIERIMEQGFVPTQRDCVMTYTRLPSNAVLSIDEGDNRFM
jgi:hypothetical protein